VSLGLGVFASVVLVLAVYHKGFRKVLLWSAVVTASLALLGTALYFGYDRYTTWKADQAAQKQKAAVDKGVRTCMTRLSTPMPPPGTTADFFPAAYFDNLAACQAYPDMDIPPPPAGFVPDSIPSGYMLDLKGKVAPIPPGATIGKDGPTIDLSAGLVPKKDARRPPAILLNPGETLGPVVAQPAQTQPRRTLKANVTCDVIVYDREKFGSGDPEAIDALRKGDTVEYVGHVTVGDQDIIRVNGRKGYVDGCIEVEP
jgi:hypothetical protein